MNAANVLFVMVASILVFFMTPGLALFYGGLSEKKNVVNTFMSVYFICGVAVIMWIIVGYSLSFPVTFGDCSGIYTGRCFTTLTSLP